MFRPIGAKMSELTERNVRPTLVGAKCRDQRRQILVQPLEGAGVETGERLREYTRQGSRSASQDPAAGGGDAQLYGATIGPILRSHDQFALDQRLDQVAGRRLVHVHRTGQIVDTDPGAASDDAQRPELRPSDTGPLFDLLEVSLDRIEDQAEPAQNPRRGLSDLAAGRARWRRDATRCCLWFCHEGMI